MKKLTFTVLCLILTTFVGAGSLRAQKQGNIELKAIAEIEIEDFNEEGKKEIKRIAAALSQVIPAPLLTRMEILCHMVNLECLLSKKLILAFLKSIGINLRRLLIALKTSGF